MSRFKTRLEKLEALKAKIKKAYLEADKITESLLDDKFKKDSGFELVDNFKSKNVVYRTTSVKRFEIVRVK